MAVTPSILKWVNSDITSGSSFVVNKGANGSTASATIVFNSPFTSSVTVKPTCTIGAVEVGGQNLLAERVTIAFEAGVYSDSEGFIVQQSGYSVEVAESENEVSKSVTMSYYELPSGYYPAFKITVSSYYSARGAKVVMSNLSLSLEGTCNISTSVTPSGAGTVTGGGSYDLGSTATLKATANTGYTFSKWSDGTTAVSRSVSAYGNVTYTAVFEKLPPEFTVAEMKYLDKRISESNKVICNEGFILSVGVI